MTTAMNSFVTELSKQVNDWFEGTIDSGDANTIVDTALGDKQSDWTSTGTGGERATTVYIKTDVGGASAAPEGEERTVAGGITVASGTLEINTVYPFSAAVGAGDTYEIHRVWSRAEKERAIVYACKRSLPHVYKEIQDRSIVFGDWLVNGGNFPKWSQTTYPDDWLLATATVTKNTTEQYIMGLPTEYSVKFAASGSAGSLYQNTAKNNDLWLLAGKSVTFYAWAYTTGASEIRLSIYDGTTTTYSDYHAGGSDWELLKATATIDTSPTDVKFSILYDTSDADAYVSRVHAIASGKHSYDITHLDIFKDSPTQIFRLIGADASDETPEPNPLRVPLNGEHWSLEPNGKLHFNTHLGDGTRIEVNGMGILTTPVSTFGGGTAVSTEVDDIYAEGQIIIAEAARKLCMDKLHAAPSQDIERWKELMAYWTLECKDRRSKYAMRALPVTR